MKASIALCFIFILLTQVTAKKACEMETIQQCLKNELAKATLTGSATTFASFISAKLALWMAGFSSIGPAGGSFAAWLQAAYGIGPIFSFLQSLAMGKLTLLLGPAVALGCITAFIYWVASCLDIDCIFSEEDGGYSKNKKEKSYWDQLKNFALKYFKIIKAKAVFLQEVFEYAIQLLWEEFYNQKQFEFSKFLEAQKKCYTERSTPNTIFEIFTVDA